MKTLEAADRRRVLAEVRTRITDHPETHDQRSWLASVPTDADPMDAKFITLEAFEKTDTDVDRWLECGTSACIAGHIVAVAIQRGHVGSGRSSERYQNIEYAAEALLGWDTPVDIFEADTSIDEILDWLDAELLEGLEVEVA